MAKPLLSSLLFGVVLLAAILGVYLPGLHHELLFDDLRLTDGAIFGRYGSLLEFKQRMLSYGSFVWVDSLWGAGWWKQRLVNIALHLGTTAALYTLVRDLLAQTRFPEDFQESPHFNASRLAACRIGVALFALNPVAVYAVSYLVQRSIVMATLFSVLACWFFVRGLTTRRAHWHVLALVSYIAAVLSKEYAVMAAAMAVPLYIHVRRPPIKTIAVIAGISAALIGIAALVFYGIYGGFIGKLFDPRSVDFAKQLEQMKPGITQRMYPLSILNEAALFFAYGFLWFVPNVAWMSVDLRPPFPLSYTSFPQLLGIIGYIALWAATLWALAKRKGVLSLVAVALCFPLLLFATEFATVWVQDPFVLYRSYLWAIAVPILIAIVFTGLSPRVIYVTGSVLVIVFAVLAFERVSSLRDDHTAWEDAAAAIDQKAAPNAVGRWRPFLNLGAYHLEKGSLSLAQENFAKADALGAVQGAAKFNMGSTFMQQKKFAEALTVFAQAEKQGFTDIQLYYQRGEAAFALGQFEQAFESFTTGLDKSAEGISASDLARMQQEMHLRRAEAAIGAQRYDEAAAGFQQLLRERPNNQRSQLGLGMALVGKGDAAKAIEQFNLILARTPNAAPAFYGRAMAHRTAGRRTEALADLDRAIALDPRNPGYAQVRTQIAGVPSK